MRIVKAEESHLDEIIALEQLCFSRPWSRQSFVSEMESDDARLAAATEEGKLLGFAILHRMGEEAELYNIAVWPENRGRGIGKELLTDVLTYARENGVKYVYLEVRAGNESARALYTGAGFRVSGLRKKYYEAPTEDAVLMEAELC